MKLAFAPLALLLASGAAQDPARPGPTFDDLGRVCIDSALNQGCGVVSVGYLSRAPGGRLYWQIQEGASAQDGVGGGIVLFRDDGDQLRAVLSDFQAWRYAAPELIEDDDTGALLLVLRGTSRAASPLDLLYVWRDEDWRPIDTQTWHEALPAMADGLTVRSGFHIDYVNLRGVTPLWRERDGRCCPSGGWAELRFDLRGDTLRLARVRRLED